MNSSSTVPPTVPPTAPPTAAGCRIELRRPGWSSPARMAEQPLGRGGEGSVHAVVVAAESGLRGPLVAKVYHPQRSANLKERALKVKAMVTLPPATEAICWPLAEVWKPARPGAEPAFAGFVMAALPTAQFRPWLELSHARDRRRSAPQFSVRYALTACRNLALALDAVHQAGHVVGDVNESNVYVGADATVRLVDADSVQVRASDGQVFCCEVGKAEYTAPELAGQQLRDLTRTPASDVFGYAVLVFQMLTGGAHPSDGVPRDLDVDPPGITERLANGWLPGLAGSTSSSPLVPPPRVPTAALPSRLRPLLAAALSPNPAARPPVGQVAAALADIEAHLLACPNEPNHYYDRRDGRCGWCVHAAAQPDPWAAQVSRPVQQTLPALTFTDPQELPAAARRTPASTASRRHPSNYTPGTRQVGPAPAGAASTSLPATRPSRRSLVVLADGSTQPRPPLLVLAGHQPGLAVACAWRELPAVCKPWLPQTAWYAGPGTRAKRWNVVAFAASLLAGALLLLGVPALADVLTRTWFPVPAALVQVVGLTGCATGAAALVLMTVSVFRRRRGLLRLTARDGAHVATLALLYGPGLVLLAVVVAAAATLWCLTRAVTGLFSVFGIRL